MNEACKICGVPWTQNPITWEYTCFLHGRPDGSLLELRVWVTHTPGGDDE